MPAGRYCGPVPVTQSPRGVDAGTRSPHAEADAAILARLWGAFAREPVPGIVGRDHQRGTLRIRFRDGTVLAADAATARPFAVAPAGFAIAVTAPGAAAPREVRAPGELIRTLGGPLGRHALRLAAEVDDSAANLARARAAATLSDSEETLLVRAARHPDPLAYLEQSVVDGHPLHPCSRTRMGLSPDEVRAYSPEHRPPPVLLREIAVPPQHWYGVAGPPRLLLHPWQHERHRDAYPWLSSVERTVPARPLMSLRTLALAGDPAHHVKTAVDIQMTSAIRTVSPASIHNGQSLSLLMTSVQRWAPGIAGVPEVGGGAVLIDGEPDRRLAVVHRRMPPLAAGELALPLAALTAAPGPRGAPLVTELLGAGHDGDALSFVERFAEVLLRPVFRLLELGVALEAHGQNVLGVLRGRRLTGLLYRDFGGVRVSGRRLGEHGIAAPALRGDIPTDDPDALRTKVFASAVSTVMAELIAALARWTGLDEERAWHRVAAVARGIEGPDVRHLFAATLPLKAMTVMRLADDATADLWCPVSNPLAGLG